MAWWLGDEDRSRHGTAVGSPTYLRVDGRVLRGPPCPTGWKPKSLLHTVGYPHFLLGSIHVSLPQENLTCRLARPLPSPKSVRRIVGPNKIDEANFGTREDT